MWGPGKKKKEKIQEIKKLMPKKYIIEKSLEKGQFSYSCEIWRGNFWAWADKGSLI